MINKTEIEKKAVDFDVKTADIQRDYVFGWFLVGIYSDSQLADLLFLKGGNALRKGYFESTRYSADLDFGTATDIDRDFLAAKIDSVCDFVSSGSGIRFEKERNRVEEKFKASDVKKRFKVFEVRVYFKDFHSGADHITIKIQLDITRFDRLYLPVQTRHLIHPYSDVGETRVEIKCAKLEEILATKLKCLLQRQHSPDLFDYVYSVFVDDGVEVNRSEVLNTFLKRTIFEPSPGVVKRLLLGLPFEIFRRYWRVVCPRASRLEFDKVVDFFKSGVEDLFGGFPELSPGQWSPYFPAEFRNPIMAAGRSRTLLRLTYSGMTRDVEPYSLAYKEPKGREPREYFYAYDLSGGTSGKCSIKSFVHERVEALEGTEVPFEPRFPIELAKAGEPVKKGYFSQPFSAGRSSGRHRPRRSLGRSYGSGIRYVLHCPYCGRTFKRKKRSNSLNKHKDKYGNPCFGRTAHYVERVF